MYEDLCELKLYKYINNIDWIEKLKMESRLLISLNIILILARSHEYDNKW